MSLYLSNSNPCPYWQKLRHSIFGKQNYSPWAEADGNLLVPRWMHKTLLIKPNILTYIPLAPSFNMFLSKSMNRLTIINQIRNRLTFKLIQILNNGIG